MKPPLKGRILIVEDDEGIATLQSTRLKRFGHFVENASTAEEAIERVERGEFDLLILDYGLSGDVNGIALFSILRERGFTFPAILVTGFDDPRIITQAMRLGVRDFLPKSIEYLDDLPLTVERVLRQVANERGAAESAALREKQEQLEAASDAARIAYFSWDIASGNIAWSGKVEDVFAGTTEHLSHETFSSLVLEEDRDALRAASEHAMQTREVYEHQYRVRKASGEIRWVFTRGRYFYNRAGAAEKMTGILMDVTDRKLAEAKLEVSSEQIQVLNDRLQLSVTETHHRVKNQLQSIISLLNLQLRDRGVIDQEGAKKIVAHIQGLAALHDVLVEQSKEDGDTRTVQLHHVCEKLISVFRRGAGRRHISAELAPCQVLAKQGASLAVILNELMSNALKHGKGDIRISLGNDGGIGELRVSNEGSQFPDDFDPQRTSRNGLFLLSLLAKSDLETQPVFFNPTETEACVTVPFPLANAERS